MTNSQEGVSIVIAAYNAEQFIRRAIESVLRQDMAVREIVVVDDGSRDQTADIVRKSGGPVKLVRQENRGPGAARNRGVRECSSELVGFVDADDELLPDMTAILAAALAEHPSAGAASGAHYYVRDGVTNRRPPPRRVTAGGAVQLLPNFFEVARRHDIAIVGSTLVRRRVFEEIGGFREDIRFAEDLDLWTRIAGRHGWVFVDRPLMVYHHSAASSSTLRTPESAKPVAFLLDERRLVAEVRPELWRSCRRYRRDMLLRQARVALVQRSLPQAWRLLAAIPPAPASLEWAATAALARSQWMASLVLGVTGLARRVARRVRSTHEPMEQRLKRPEQGMVT